MIYKVDERLDELLDIQNEIVQVEKTLPVISTSHTREENKSSRKRFWKKTYFRQRSFKNKNLMLSIK